MNFERTGVKKLNNVLFLACIVGAILGWLGAECIYKILPTSMPTTVQVGIYFSILMLSVSLTSFVSELIVNRSKSSWAGNEILRSIFFIITSVIIFGLLGMLFQFIYGLGYTKKQTAQIDDYFFVIDNSGSTDGSDPDNLRFSEVESLISRLNPNNRFAIEVFDDTIDGKIPLSQVNDSSIADLSEFNNRMTSIEKGGTEIQLVLSDVVDNYTLDGRNAAVILLSDGESNSPIDYKYLGNSFLGKNLPIYCVAFSNMGRSGVKTMTRLAEYTDGYYCEIDDLSNLQLTINNMLELTSRRSLLERRRGSDTSNILAMLLRILFVSTLGILVEIALALILDYEDLLKSALFIHIPFSILAGIVAEFIMKLLAYSNVTRLIMCVLMSVVVVSYMKYTYSLENSWDMDTNWNDVPSLQARKSKTSSDLKRRNRNKSHNNSSFL